MPPLDFSPLSGLGRHYARALPPLDHGQQQQQQQQPAASSDDDRPSALHFVVLDRPIPPSATQRPSSPLPHHRHEQAPPSPTRQHHGNASHGAKTFSCLCVECHFDRNPCRLRALVILVLLGVMTYSLATTFGMSRLSIDSARQVAAREMQRIYEDKAMRPGIPDMPVNPSKMLLAPGVVPLDVESMRTWGEENLVGVDKVLVPFAADVFSAMCLHPRAEVFIAFGQNAPSGDVEAAVTCDANCLVRARAASVAAFDDFRAEGFATPATLRTHAQSSPLGALPVVTASIVAAGGKLIHAENIGLDAELPACIKLVVESSVATMQVVIYCGVESVLQARQALRRVLRPQGLFSVVMRGTGYGLSLGVLTSDQAALNHLRAMIMLLAKQIVQDDSGLPYSVLRRHLATSVYGDAYRGFASPDLVGLAALPGSVLKSLYQKDLAKAVLSGPLPFHFGHRTTIEPGATEADPFVKRSSWKGSILIVAKPVVPATRHNEQQQQQQQRHD